MSPVSRADRNFGSPHAYVEAEMNTRTRTDDTTARRTAPRRTRGGERRTREAGGPQDRALYRCACGHQFSTSVSTSVTCPRCGADQSW
jgi:hypothetical protein